MATNERVNKCVVCGEPMPPNEQMFRFHGYSGPCPKPPLPTPPPARGEEILHRNTRVTPGKEFVGEWVAVPDEDFRWARERFAGLSATLTATEARLAEAIQQRDAAVAIAREAVQGWLDGFPGVEGESKFDEVAARLAQIGGK